MIDAQNRKEPRFPSNKEEIARQEIEKHLLKEKENIKSELKGIAGGACGGDILFHELCEQIDIPSEIYLALPVDEFKNTSVSFAGKHWEERFDKLVKKLPVHLLPAAKDNKENDNIWERTNLWMLDNALKNGGNNMTLIALWDGKGGDGSGGTEHMVNVAKEHEAEVIIIEIDKL
jgi:hypothetical protein